MRWTWQLNQHYLDADFGYAGVGIIRGLVYLDLNNDGVQQPSEPGIPNVQICLYLDANHDGTPDFEHASGLHHHR